MRTAAVQQPLSKDRRNKLKRSGLRQFFFLGNILVGWTREKRYFHFGLGTNVRTKCLVCQHLPVFSWRHQGLKWKQNIFFAFASILDTVVAFLAVSEKMFSVVDKNENFNNWSIVIWLLDPCYMLHWLGLLLALMFKKLACISYSAESCKSSQKF